MAAAEEETEGVETGELEIEGVKTEVVVETEGATSTVVEVAVLCGAIHFVQTVLTLVTKNVETLRVVLMI